MVDFLRIADSQVHHRMMIFGGNTHDYNVPLNIASNQIIPKQYMSFEEDAVEIGL
jgi:hypothetical protein